MGRVAGDAARAMTLTELLVTLALVGLVAAATLGFLEQGHRAWAAGAARAETQQSARVALTRMVADVRAAGFGGDAFDAVAVAEPQRMVLQQDHDADGTIGTGPERVTWRLAASVLRRDAGGGAQPVVNGVSALEIRYFDAAGAVTATPREVRAIAVTLAIEPEHGPRSAATIVSTLVRLRNR